jgi:uncharacterized protein YyaL (SSP411 family)
MKPICQYEVTTMPNRLANENSPYLLQHAENPVDWYPWGEDALEKSRSEDKPIFLSVGYAACHWCHVMAHESFEDEDTAALMNEHFINIKVDREERPDIDSIYMQAVVAMTRQGGWPMSVFLTPDGQPFFGGTYFPPERRYNMSSFKEVLGSVIRIWQENRGSILESADQITRHLQNAAQTRVTSRGLNKQVLDQAISVLAQGYDGEFGGWGQAPKFPQPMVIEVLLRQATRGDKDALAMAEHALTAMAKGGMYDVVGGGFARYSVDDRWLVPHFEKMLYDNAQLAQVYLHAYVITGNDLYRRVCEETLDFVVREMTHPQGGFFSSLDADSEGEEGKFYIWTPEAIQAAIPDPEDVRLISSAYGVTFAGNFEGATILQRIMDDAQIAGEFDLPIKSIPGKLAELHTQLLAYRAQRVRPGTDDKVLVSWNGLMLVAFAEAGRYLKRVDYTQIAVINAGFLLTEMLADGHLLRTWRDGFARYNAYLEDYAALILGLIALYQTDHQTRWFREALSLTEDMVAHFQDTSGGFFDTRDDHETLILRPKDTQDNAFPSGNALAALALLQLSAYTENGEWRTLAEEMLQNMVGMATKYPTSFGQWLSATDFAVGPVQEVAVLGEPDTAAFQAFSETLWKAYRPRTVAAFSPHPPVPDAPTLLENRPLFNALPTAYVCQGFVCRQPVNSPEEMVAQLVNNGGNI